MGTKKQINKQTDRRKHFIILDSKKVTVILLSASDNKIKVKIWNYVKVEKNSGHKELRIMDPSLK